MKRSESGQALIEWAFLLPLYVGLFASTFWGYWEWRQELGTYN